MQTRPRPVRYRRKNRKSKVFKPGPPGYTLGAHQVVARPLVTEKGTHQITRYNAYCFQVHPTATKPQIKAAIEELYPVRVQSVRTQIRHGKSRRYRNVAGKMPDWKKAVVQLHPDDRIEFI